MPVNINNNLPAIEVLRNENIFVMEESRAKQQDIRPLKIILLNIMPTKITTETQFLRMLSNSPLQVELHLLHMAGHKSKNTSEEHLDIFYENFDQIKDKKFDGLIITGAPVELLEFEEVDYWEDLCKIMDWSRTNVTSTLHICWAAQAGLYHHYGINKYKLHEKMFGVFWHSVSDSKVPLVRGFDDRYMAPHSRHTEIRMADVEKHPDLFLLSKSEAAGAYIVVSKKQNQIFVTGHSEYDVVTLRDEYLRDVKKGLSVNMPRNYFPYDDPTRQPIMTWRSHANLLFSNWLNYYVYQETPYDWD